MLSTDEQGNTLEELIGAKNTACFTVRRATMNGTFKRNEEAFFYGVVTQGSGTLRIGDEVTELKQWSASSVRRV